jgi:hypothetical protein
MRHHDDDRRDRDHDRRDHRDRRDEQGDDYSRKAPRVCAPLWVLVCSLTWQRTACWITRERM